ncbi:polysaccharide lyase family 8 super-sandwich domain-containing protein [Niabella aurantiaca]|uniref:polysaccharide lyase family 8 super-sandwich domain-containing protein n=1 Tax=Niabella aurantiaca TaxID=379900 RepID=UPI00037C7C6D|nr:polysaccharide lyase family 8 super-sandwich domain-containing protein [Niabella aurantiaca]
MKRILIIICIALFSATGNGQQKYYDFNSAIPANFSSSNGKLTLSGEHTKDGEQALKWVVQKGAVLMADELGIPLADIGSRNAGSAQFFIYSPRISGDTLVFRFYDKAGVMQREGHMLLNYKGWRDYHRSYRFDYNRGNELPGFALDRMEIRYQPRDPAAAITLYLDAFRVIGDPKDRYPGPHMRIDREQFAGKAAEMLGEYLHTPDIAVAAASAQELLDAQKVKLFYPRRIPPVSASNLAAAKSFVTACAIRRNTDHTITGRGQLFLDHEDTLLQASRYCAYLSEAAIRNADTDAKNKLIDLVSYLLDQGLAEGGRLFLHLGHYRHSLGFPVGFLEGMSLYPDSIRSEVIKMLKWQIGYNRIYSRGPVDPNTDFMHLRSDFLFELAALAPSPGSWVSDLKCISRYLGLFVHFTEGSADGLKVDGCAFHHGAHYLGYMYAMGTYVDRIYSLKNTVYRVSAGAYRNISLLYKASYLQSSAGAIYANAASGRNPFSGFPIPRNKLEKLVEVGGDILGGLYDPELAAFYNYIFHTRKYPVAQTAFDGYYQYNYGQLGVLRKDNWVAVMRGFTNRLWGTEIYVTENRYGRYQSYGSLEVLYNGDTAATGYPAQGGNGWDWNVAPGTTTVHLPFSELQAKQGRADEYNENSFAGALSLGKDGIFAMDFVERAGNKYSPNHMQFHKSVFAFDGILVCLGSGIRSSNTAHTTATNLFQAVSASANPPVYINAPRAIKEDHYDQRVSTENKAAWLVNGQTTGFFVPQGGGTIVVARGLQDAPVETSLTGTPTVRSRFSKAYIDHGTAPGNAGYCFVAVPGTTPKKMELLSARFASGKIYRILSRTDSLHAVAYLPGKLTAYVFFEANDRVNIGVVKRVSGRALVGIKESGNGITLTINNPDLNAVDAIATKWRSTEYRVSLQLEGNWTVAANPSGARVVCDGGTTTAGFVLKDGRPATLKLLREGTGGSVLLN